MLYTVLIQILKVRLVHQCVCLTHRISRSFNSVVLQSFNHVGIFSEHIPVLCNAHFVKVLPSLRYSFSTDFLAPLKQALGVVQRRTVAIVE